MAMEIDYQRFGGIISDVAAATGIPFKYWELKRVTDEVEIFTATRNIVVTIDGMEFSLWMLGKRSNSCLYNHIIAKIEKLSLDARRMSIVDEIKAAIVATPKRSADDLIVLCGITAYKSIWGCGGFRQESDGSITISGVRVYRDRDAPPLMWRVQPLTEEMKSVVRGWPREWLTSDSVVREMIDDAYEEGAEVIAENGKSWNGLPYAAEMLEVLKRDACPVCGATDHETIEALGTTIRGCPKVGKHIAVTVRNASVPTASLAPYAVPGDQVTASISSGADVARLCFNGERWVSADEVVNKLSLRGREAGGGALNPIEEDFARSEWSCRLRELQAEARKREREQVVIDLECVG